MTARQIKKQLEELGWSMSEAARQLGIPSGKSRVSEWCRGIRTVPPYIEAHMKTIHQGVSSAGWPAKYWAAKWRATLKELEELKARQ